MDKKEILKTFPGAMIIESKKLVIIKPQSVINAKYNKSVDMTKIFEDNETLGGIQHSFTFVCHGDKEHTSITGENNYIIRDKNHLVKLLTQSIKYYCEKHPIPNYTIEIDFDSLEQYASNVWETCVNNNTQN